MIIVTRRDRGHTKVSLNPDLILNAHAAPDTTLHMVDGHVYVIEESLEELIELIVQYRARILAVTQGVLTNPEA